MRENEKKWEELKASLQKFAIKSKVSYNILSLGFYSQTPIKNTKITNQTLLQKGTNQEEIQKVTKNQKVNSEQWQVISQPLRNFVGEANLRKFAGATNLRNFAGVEKFRNP